jgi:hypothetical protein
MNPSSAASLILAGYRGELPAICQRLDIAGVQAVIVGDTLVVLGSNEWHDWAYNLLAVPWPGDTHWWHKGFLLHARPVYAFAKGKPVKRVIGHSLGAASGAITAWSLGLPGIGFNAPRCVWSSAPNLPGWVNHNRRGDLVSHVPIGCRHLGHVVWHSGRDHGIAGWIEKMEAAA